MNCKLLKIFFLSFSFFFFLFSNIQNASLASEIETNYQNDIFVNNSNFVANASPSSEQSYDSSQSSDSSFSPSGSFYSYIIMLFIIIIIFYFFIIRPQNKRVEEQKNMIASIKVGTHVIFAGGLIGVVKKVTDERILCNLISTDTHVWALKYSVYSVIEEEKITEDIKKIDKK